MDIVKQLAMHGHSPDATISEKRPKKRPSSSKEDKKSVKRRKAQPESTHTVHELKDEPAVQIGSEIPEKAEVARTDLITKRKKTHHDREDGTSSSKHTQAGQSVKGKRKSKKQNAREVASLKTSPEAATTTAEVPANGGSRPSSEGAGLDPAAEEAQESMQGKAQRFICFIGNLPYTTTSASLTSHFSSISPASVRHITDKTDPKKSKGFAFLEFDHYDKMKTCLKLYHHSSFYDGQSPARRINVQLTAGGGGSKSAGRKEKLRVKNERLGGQRVRRALTEDIQRKKDGRNGRGSATTVGVDGGE